MTNTIIIDLIAAISTPPTDEELTNFKAAIINLVKIHQIKEPPAPYAELYQADEFGKTPCHYAAEKSFHLLAILALDGNAPIPDDLTYPNAEHILQLKQEQEKCQNINLYQRDYHLHSLIRKVNGNDIHNKLIFRRIFSHPSEINQKSYLDRNACHWAAIMGMHRVVAC